jgi:hypothetical protein
MKLTGQNFFANENEKALPELSIEDQNPTPPHELR